MIHSSWKFSYFFLAYLLTQISCMGEEKSTTIKYQNISTAYSHEYERKPDRKLSWKGSCWALSMVINYTKRNVLPGYFHVFGGWKISLEENLTAVWALKPLLISIFDMNWECLYQYIKWKTSCNLQVLNSALAQVFFCKTLSSFYSSFFFISCNDLSFHFCHFSIALLLPFLWMVFIHFETLLPHLCVM